MNTILVAFIAGIILSLITAFADALIKHASLQKSFSGWPTLFLGALIYGLTAFGWFFVVRKMKLSTAGVLYAVSVVIFVTLASVFYFKERISPLEIIGVLMAIGSLAILYRFS